MPRFILQGTGDGRVYELPSNGRFRIGRSRHSDLCIDHPSISETHCEVYVDPMMVQVTDMGSTNGTFINGSPIQKGELSNGQILQVGSLTLLLEMETHRVVMPELENHAAPRPITLANGFACCFNHPEAPAVMECKHCNKTFCRPCVHVIGLVGGKRHYLCPSCHNHCSTYTGGVNERKGFLGGLVAAVKKITGRFRSN